MKRIINILQYLAMIIIFISCHSEVTNDGEPNLPENENTSTEVIVNVNLPDGLKNHHDLTINSLVEDIPFNDEKVVLNSNYNNLPQVLFVTDSEDNILLMSKECINADKIIMMDIESTAMALAALNPLFANIDSDRYQEVERLILNSPSFPNLVLQVENTVNKGIDIFNEGNTELFVELSNVWDAI